MELFEILQQYMVPIIFALCAALGYILKAWTPLNNNYINLIMCGTGVLSNIILNSWIFSIDILVGGLASALIATGTYEFIKNGTKILKGDNAVIKEESSK